MGVGFPQAPSWSPVQRDGALSTGRVRCWLSRAADERDAQLGDRGDASQTTPGRALKTGVLCRECDQKVSQKTPKRVPDEPSKRVFCVVNATKRCLKRRQNGPPKRPFCVVNATKNRENEQKCSMFVPRLSIWPENSRKRGPKTQKIASWLAGGRRKNPTLPLISEAMYLRSETLFFTPAP